MTFSVALTLPVRPSSNFTCGLDVLIVLPAVQRIDQLHRNFSPMKPRRTLRVRVSSPSSASSSLCRTRKRLNLALASVGRRRGRR